METFQECGLQMLREFRALLQQTPLPVNQTRLLQLLALNMFAVSNTQLKGINFDPFMFQQRPDRLFRKNAETRKKEYLLLCLLLYFTVIRRAAEGFLRVQRGNYILSCF